MPKLDGTGPMGQGPRTGRRMCGCCFSTQMCGNRQATLTKEQQLEALKEEREVIEKEIADLEKIK
jgi:hypothetical protein